MSDDIWCLDTGVMVKYLVAEDPPELTDAAVQVVHAALERGRIVAPAFAWAEIGSVLRKKVRLGFIRAEEADTLWRAFSKLPVRYVDSPALRSRTWEIARQYNLSTLYDAGFLACTEVAAPAHIRRQFWTTDERLVHSLGTEPPSYLRQLGEDTHGHT